MTYLDKEAEASKNSPHGCSGINYQSVVGQWDARFKPPHRTLLKVSIPLVRTVPKWFHLLNPHIFPPLLNSLYKYSTRYESDTRIES